MSTNKTQHSPLVRVALGLMTGASIALLGACGLHLDCPPAERVSLSSGTYYAGEILFEDGELSHHKELETETLVLVIDEDTNTISLSSETSDYTLELGR